MARNKRSKVWVWLRRLGLALALIVAVPLVLVPVYAFVPPVSTVMLWRMATGQPVTREWRDLDQVSDRLKVALVMSEDGQFCRHWGVDVTALRTEIEKLLAGEDVRGASTISMQVARNLFLWLGQDYVRKALEIPLAVYLDLVLPKRRIMEIYLNIAEWGPGGEFGVEAGTQRAFGMDADALSWPRATLMVAALPNPHVRLPARPSAGMLRVASIVEGRARQYADRAGCLFDGSEPELD